MNPAAASAPTCPNCDRLALGEYCAHCGQRQSELNQSLRAWIADIADDQLGLSAKLPRTLSALLFHPAGRRARYFAPVKLYLGIVVVAFTMFALSPMKDYVDTLATRSATDAVAATGDQASDASLRGLLSDPQGLAGIAPQLIANYPRAMLLVLPGLALVLMLMYRKQDIRYLGHLTFGLHLYSFNFCVWTLVFILVRDPASGAMTTLITGVAAAAMWIYQYVALLRVYRESRGRTAVKFLALAFADGTLRAVASIVLTLLLLNIH